jgi:hypothetical protein
MSKKCAGGGGENKENDIGKLAGLQAIFSYHLYHFT